MADLTGQTIGNYRIDALLGTGGMGQVFRGQHRHLERQAAIKVMHAHLAIDPGFQERFLREARAAAALNHPNIVQIYDFGEQEGRFYLVMELMEDASLTTLLQAAKQSGGRIELRLGLDIIRQAAEGLAYAHARGMVHRDVKPDNLLIEREEEPDTGIPYIAKVCDFGLARLIESSMLTGTGMLMGTPAYMSPEQAQGLPLDGRSDQYALGVVLYEVVTGQRPFDTRTPTDAIFKHVYTQPDPPRHINPALPEAVDAIVMRCLAKPPDERYASTEELSKALGDAITALEQPQVVTTPTPTRSMSPDHARMQLIGKQLGRYVVEAPLGASRLTWTYRATHIALRRPVVLKVLRPELAREPACGRRFIHEAQVAARLRHSNVVEIFDAGIAGDQSFVAMALIEGQLLREILDERQPGLDAALGYVRQLAAALDYAHERGVIHRDLNPDTIVIRADDSLVVTDFGIAAAAEEIAGARGGPMTVGTPAYLAPEQVTGRPVSARTDVYALGCVTYKLLTGQPPFAGPTFESLVDAHLSEIPPPVHTRALDVPIELSAVVARALAKNPEIRHDSAGAFAAALAAAVPSTAAQPAATAVKARSAQTAAPVATATPPGIPSRPVTTVASPTPSSTPLPSQVTPAPVASVPTPQTPTSRPASQAPPATPAPRALPLGLIIVVVTLLVLVGVYVIFLRGG